MFDIPQSLINTLILVVYANTFCDSYNKVVSWLGTPALSQGNNLVYQLETLGLVPA